MSTTVTYKGSTLTTVDNQTRTLKTAGKYMEGDVVLTDVSSSGGYVTQDQDGFIVLPPDGGGSPSVGGLVYETGTWTPSENVAQPVISFTNTHSTPPMYVMMADATGTNDLTASTNYGFAYLSFYEYTGQAVPSNETTNRRYALADYVYVSSTSPSQAVSGITALTGSGSYAAEYWVSETGFIPSSASTTRTWKAGRTYKWIAVWAPTT